MRSDDTTFVTMLRNGELFKWTIFVLMIGNAFLGLALFLVANRPVQIVAVQPNGQAAWTASASEQVIRNMALYDTREFLEGLHTKDAIIGPAARKKSLWFLAPNVREQITKQVADSTLLMRMAQSRVQCRIEWDIPPKVVNWNYPGVRIFAAFQIVTIDEQGHENREKHNITVDGAFFGSTEARPSGYLITRFTYVTDGRDLNTILNKIGG